MELYGTSRGCLDDSNCVYPSGSSELCSCLGSCIAEINEGVQAGFEKVGRLVIVPYELSVENSELTPSFKLIPHMIEAKFRSYMKDPVPDDALIVKVGDM